MGKYSDNKIPLGIKVKKNKKKEKNCEKIKLKNAKHQNLSDGEISDKKISLRIVK